jgi:hypothetical protein
VQRGAQYAALPVRDVLEIQEVCPICCWDVGMRKVTVLTRHLGRVLQRTVLQACSVEHSKLKYQIRMCDRIYSNDCSGGRCT